MRPRRRVAFALLPALILIASALAPSIAEAHAGHEPIAVPPAPPPPGAPYPFTDIESSGFQIQIAWLYNSNVTGGCSATKFCPTGNVTREQMASFLVRALGLPATTRDFFTDDNASAHEGDINRLAAARITGGCTASRFCPRSLVTREQMASFLARALQLPAATRDYFSDDNASIHESNINRLAASNITGGCATGRYCPSASVKREQMAAFLFRAMVDYVPSLGRTALSSPQLEGSPTPTGSTGDPYPSFPISQLVCEAGRVWASAPVIRASKATVGGAEAYVNWIAILYYHDGVTWQPLANNGWHYAPVTGSDFSLSNPEGTAGPTWYPLGGGQVVQSWINWAPSSGWNYGIVHIVLDNDSNAGNASYTTAGFDHCFL